MNQKKVQEFVELGKKLDTDSVLYIMLGNLVLSVVGIIFSYNPRKSAMVIISFTVITFFIFMFYKINEHRQKRRYTQQKYINLYVGILGILTSVTCQICCLMIIPFSISKIMVMVCALVITNILVMLTISFIVYRMIHSKKKMGVVSSVSIGVTGIGALIGTWIARNTADSYQQIGMCFVFGIFSLIFSVFIVFIIKYYCYRLLDKLNDN